MSKYDTVSLDIIVSEHSTGNKAGLLTAKGLVDSLEVLGYPVSIDTELSKDAETTVYICDAWAIWQEGNTLMAEM